ncbi:transmembrane protein 17B-like [Helicoverpa zea]|uniref:transmembrane protein 17B-like n=1 Tax=Helicoverpa zea TaxID=7113 RepID=UPI001F5AE213|nr:transmembrane protein 17B-like [Helicoverpa zea]
MEYRMMLYLQKCLYFNFYLFITWVFVVGFFLYTKLNRLGHLTRYLSLTVYTLLIVIESARIYLGDYGNLSRGVPELAGFLMLTILMQIPLLSFFLFNPFLMSTPMEMTLHAMLWLITFAEIICSYTALRQASSYAKSVYFLQFLEKEQ